MKSTPDYTAFCRDCGECLRPEDPQRGAHMNKERAKQVARVHMIQTGHVDTIIGQHLQDLLNAEGP